MCRRLINHLIRLKKKGGGGWQNTMSLTGAILSIRFDSAIYVPINHASYLYARIITTKG